MLGNLKEIYDGLCFLGVYISIPNIGLYGKTNQTKTLRQGGSHL
jgi:hypothetical protein